MSVAPVQVPVAFLFICTAAQVGGEVGSDGSSWACVNTHPGSRGESGCFPPARGFFYCPLFLTQNRPLKNIGHSLKALLWPEECFVYAYWQNISVLWHVYTGTRINWERKKGERGWREHLAHFMQVLPGKLSGYQLGKHRPPVFSSPQTSDTQADVTAHLQSRVSALYPHYNHRTDLRLNASVAKDGASSLASVQNWNGRKNPSLTSTPWSGSCESKTGRCIDT